MSIPTSQTILEEQKVELFLGCDDLVSEDFIGKGDPFVILYLKNSFSPQFVEIGRTEVIYNTGNPKFATRFTLNYSSKENAILRFDVYDCDKDNSRKLNDHDFIGTYSVYLSEIIRAKDTTCRFPLKRNNKDILNSKTNKLSTLNITVEAISNDNDDQITLQFAAKNLPDMNGIIFKNGCDPCFDIYRMSASGDQLICVKEKCNPIKETLNPTWSPFTISCQRLCNGDYKRPIEIHVWDWDSPKKYNYIGKWITNCDELKAKKSGNLVDNNGKKEGKLGTIECIKFETKKIYKGPTFADYSKQCEVIFGIDFTASNVDQDKKSLHHIDTEHGKLNLYQKAIHLVGNIISTYSNDNKYPVYGFGAKLPDTEVLHDFAINFDEKDPFINGIDGIEEAYIKALESKKLEFFEDKLFAPILKKSLMMAKKAQEINKQTLQYFILVIITNGCLNDKQNAIDLIVEIANKYLPLSIIIIGVGDSHFPILMELEGKHHPLKNTENEVAVRNVVRFVALNEITNTQELQYETLKDIPNQFMSYAKHHKIFPKGHKSQDDIKSEHQDISHEKVDPKLNKGNKPEDEINYENMPLPEGWTKGYDENGNVFYINHVKKTTQWEHPLKPSQH